MVVAALPALSEPDSPEYQRLHDEAAESIYLGLLLQVPEHFHALSHAGWVQPQDFTRERHRLIYEAMLALDRKAQVPDVPLVYGELAARGHLERVAPSTLAQVVADSPAQTPERVQSYGLRVREAALRREVLSVAEAAVRVAHTPGSPLAGMVVLQERLSRAAERLADGEAHARLSMATPENRINRGVLVLPTALDRALE